VAGRVSFQKALGCSDRHGGPTDGSESETGVIAGMTLGADVLIPASDIQEKVREIGARINEDYRGKKPLLVGILRGAVVVLADLMRNVELACEIDFMEVGSYGLGSTSSGVVRILKDLQEDITGRHVLIVEDIIDTGLTMSYLHDLLLTRKPASLESFVLLSKPSRRQVDIDVKYVGFEVPDVFVVGYGIDYAGAYRNLPDILALELEAASE
jgi:hypoxanthine phosphoribosyltransferase